jgi:hypothetical protein
MARADLAIDEHVLCRSLLEARHCGMEYNVATCALTHFADLPEGFVQSWCVYCDIIWKTKYTTPEAGRRLTKSDS